MAKYNLSSKDLVDYKTSSRPGEVFIQCPFCSEEGHNSVGKYKLGVNQDKGIFNCFVCSASGMLSDTIINSLSYHKKKKGLESFKDSLNKKLKVRERTKSTSYNLDNISIPISRKSTPSAYSYLEKRKISHLIDELSLRIGIVYEEGGVKIKKYSNRILFPSFDLSGECNFFTAGSISGEIPKYLNSLGSKSNVVYGIDRVTDDTCIVCEGIISSIRAEISSGISSVAILGKFISRRQAELIKKVSKTVYLCLDGDTTIIEREKNSEILYSEGIDVKIINLPLEYGIDGSKLSDPDDHFLEFETYLHNYVQYKTFLGFRENKERSINI